MPHPWAPFNCCDCRKVAPLQRRVDAVFGKSTTGLRLLYAFLMRGRHRDSSARHSHREKSRGRQRGGEEEIDIVAKVGVLVALTISLDEVTDTDRDVGEKALWLTLGRVILVYVRNEGMQNSFGLEDGKRES
jgi:hypothetical protein